MKRRNLKEHFVRLLWLAVFCGIAFSVTVSAGNATTIIVGVYENPPKIFSDVEGVPAGFWSDILRYVAAKEGWEIEWVDGTWAQGLERLENNDIDVLPDTGFTEPRAEKFAFSSETVLLSWSRVYARHGAGIDSLFDLEGKKIGALANSFNLDGPSGLREITGKFEINCTFIEMDSYVDVFEALENGSIDAGVTNKDFGNAYEAQYAVKRTPIIFQPARMQFAFPKGSSLTPHLIERIDYHLKTLKADGNSIYYQSLEKWLTVEPIEKPIISRQILWLLVGLGGLIFLLFGGSFILRSRVRYKTRELRQQIAERQQVEEKLHKSEIMYKFLFDKLGDAVFIVDYDGKILVANPAACQQTGYSCEELIGMNIIGDLAVAEPEITCKNGAERLALGETLFFEEEKRRKDGTTYISECVVTKIEYNGQFATLSVNRDITRRIQAEEALRYSFSQLAEATSRAMETQDPYTVGHQRQVAELAKKIGEKMELDQDRLSGLYIGGLLHDIGKIAVPSEILTQPGKLSEVEWGIIRSHPRRGYQILEGTDFPWPVADMALHHHERLDGSGYPDGLKGDQLSLEVCILGVCDVVDAMSSDRPYRAARPQEMVIEELRTGRGTRYDEKVVDIMLGMLETVKAKGRNGDGASGGREKQRHGDAERGRRGETANGRENSILGSSSF